MAKIKRSWDGRAELDPRLLQFLWFTGVCFMGISIFATHTLSVIFQQGSEEQFKIGTSVMDPRKQLTVTIFTAPAPFEGSVASRQTVAIDSWLRLAPCPSVVLLGEHSSFHAFASERTPHVTVDSPIDSTFLGKPLFHAMVQRALKASTDIVMLIYPEVILLDHVFQVLQSIHGFNQDWLLAALPLVVPGFQLSLHGKGAHVDDREVEAYVRDNGIWDTCEGAQLWAWNGNKKPLHAGIMPPFVFTEGQHNNWLLTEAITSKYRVVLDGSQALNVFRPQPARNSTFDTSSISLVNKATSNSPCNSGNSWLASTYGSYYFRPLNFSHIPIKLVSCGGLQSHKLCLVNISQHPCSCSPLNLVARPAKRPTVHEQKETWPLFHHPPTWMSWFEDLAGWTKRDPVGGSWYMAGSNTHGHVYSLVEELMRSPIKRKQADYCDCNSVTSHQSVQCRDSKTEGSKIDASDVPYSLESLVSMVASEDKVVILAVVGNSYRDMLMSWVCRLKHLHISNFLVSALDDDIYDFAALQGLPVFRSRLDMDVSRDDCHFGSACFQNVTKMKSRTVLRILQLGFHVLFSDVDVYWFKDPSKELMSFGPGHLPAQTDQWNESVALNEPRRLNSGFYFAWADPHTVVAFENIIKHGATSEKSEQPSFYDTLCGADGEYRVGNDICLDPKLNVTVHFLDPVKYPNGAYRTMWQQKDVRSACMAQDCRVLHNNWLPGRLNKLNRQIASGLWEYDGITRLCLPNRE